MKTNLGLPLKVNDLGLSYTQITAMALKEFERLAERYGST